MLINTIINIIAIIISPIVAVLVGRFLQKRDKSRNDKMEIFRTLMIDRGLGWSIESAKALNVIEIVFCDDQKVLNQWKKYYDKLCIDNPTDAELSMVKAESDKLLDVMAQSLGYKDKVTWETIQKPYVPKGLTANMVQQQQFLDNQSAVMNMMNLYMQQMVLSNICSPKDEQAGNDTNEKAYKIKK